MAQRKRPPARGQKSRPAARPSNARPRPQRAAQPAAPRPFVTEGASPFRQRVERRSALVAVFLHRLPRALPGVIVALLVAGGLLAPPPLSGLILLVVALLLLWLVFLSWPALRTPAKALRAVVIALVTGYALTRF